VDNFIKELKKHRHFLPKQTIKTIRGQALSGDLEGAKRGLKTALNKTQSNRDKMINAHRGTRYMKKQYNNIDYHTQLGIYLRGQ
jgi:hypothetical protein